MCQSVPNRRGRAAAAAVLASATADGGVKGASQPSIAVAEEEKQPFSSSLASTTNKPQTLTGDPSQRQPTALPPFTIGTLRKAIPPHCFERSLLRSSLSLALDLSLAAVLAVAAAAGIPRMVPASCAYSPLLRGLAWLAYWWFQGAICTGIWVQAHECGHQAFSPSQSVNDAVGLVLHSLLLVRFSTRSFFFRFSFFFLSSCFCSLPACCSLCQRPLRLAISLLFFSMRVLVVLVFFPARGDFGFKAHLFSPLKRKSSKKKRSPTSLGSTRTAATTPTRDPWTGMRSSSPP